MNIQSQHCFVFFCCIQDLASIVKVWVLPIVIMSEEQEKKNQHEVSSKIMSESHFS